MVRRAAAILAMACLLAGCESNAGMQRTLPAAPNSGPRVGVPLRVFIPNHIGRHRLGHAHLSRGMRGALHQLFIAASTAGMEVAVFPHGLRTGLVAKFVGDASNTSKNCTHVTDGRVCSYALSVPPGGPYDFVFGTFDQAPSGGTIPGGAAQLGAAIDTARIVAGKANTLRVTVGGVVAKTFMYAPVPQPLHAIASQTVRLTIGAQDADGNVIASDSYVNASGDPVTIVPMADSNAGTTMTFAPAKISSPSAGGVILRYSALAATTTQLTGGFSTVISASANNGGGVSAASLTIAVQQPWEQFRLSTDPGPLDVAAYGPYAYLTTVNGDNISLYDGTQVISERPTPFTGSSPEGITVDSSGTGWFAQAGDDAIGYIRLDVNVTIYKFSFISLPTGTIPVRITSGPDGALWFTEYGTNAIGRQAMSNGVPVGSPTSYPLPTADAGPQFIVTGPDGAIWFTESASGKIGRIPVNATPGSGAQIKEYSLPDSGSDPLGIVSANDGALWFTENGEAKIGRITTTGAITEFPVPSGSTFEIAKAPDGSLWFTEGYASKFGRILTTATPANPGIVEFDTSDAGSSPAGIAVNERGEVYYTEYGADYFVGFW